MLLTVFVDASHCQKTKVAGYGAWAKRADWPKGLFIGAALPTCRNAAEAELRGIAHALETLDRNNVDAIMIQCDCLRALQLIRFGVPNVAASSHANGAPVPMVYLKPSGHERESLTAIAALQTRLIVRHVRGHKAETDGRQWVNNRCDYVAKSWMRSARTKLIQECVA